MTYITTMRSMLLGRGFPAWRIHQWLALPPVSVQPGGLI